MKLILHYLKKYKRLVFFDILSIFSFALVELGIPTIMAGIIDEGIALSDMEYIRRKGILLLVIAVVGGARQHSAWLLLDPYRHEYHPGHPQRYFCQGAGVLPF